MDDLCFAQRPRVKPQHRLVACGTCPHVGGPCEPGLRLLRRLRDTAETIGGDFQISGTLRLGLCKRSCKLAWRATVGTTWVFGDIAEEDRIEALIAEAGETVVLISEAGVLQ